MNYKVIESKYSEFLLNIKEYFSKEDNIVIYDKRNIIKVIRYNNQKYVIKSFKIPHIINKIVYKFFRDSKAKRSYVNSVKLIELNINTPKPIGYIEFDTAVFFKESFYISEFFDFDFEIRAVFIDDKFENRVEILEKFVEFTYDLHNKGVYHIDYSPGNILIKKIDGEYQFYIIDVNRMKFLEFDLDLRMKSISKLTSNNIDNEFIAKYYSQIANLNSSELLEKYNFYLDEQQKYLANKKKLKKLRS
ncbi:MAG: hypothetical protein KAJ49_08095 [Arcobacteraceae bacterium]|nr:hypothetical protein [Arcobacteraceae bacterium]